MINEITSAFCREKYAANKKGKNASHNLKEIIESFNTKHSLPDIKINKSKIIMHAFRNNPLVVQLAGGRLSPMLGVEPQFIAIVVNMRKFCPIITDTQVFRLANSLIKEKPIENEIREWKTHNLFTNNNLWLCANGATLWVGYWRGFIARNSRLIKSKRGQKFSVERLKWTTYQNYNQLYDHMYNKIVK